MKIRKYDYSIIKDTVRCMESKIFRQVLKLEIEKLLSGTNFDIAKHEINPTAPSLDSRAVVVYMHLRDNDNEQLQVWLMSQKDTGIDNDGDLGITLEKKLTFVTPKMIDLRIRIIIYSKLSEDDIITLDLLGKVHRRVIPAQPARVETSIYCEI